MADGKKKAPLESAGLWEKLKAEMGRAATTSAFFFGALASWRDILICVMFFWHAKSRRR
jgi:hypothetical protein